MLLQLQAMPLHIVANNTNTTIITNTANIIDLKKWVDIDGNGSDADLTSWDVSHVTDASRAFFDATTFNQNIGNWDVRNVTNMSHMFLNAKAFNQNISGWHVGKVTNMTYMFHNATSFNQNIGSWDVGKVTDMSYMFSSADAFNQNIGNWNVSNVTTMDSMFWAATAFNQDIGNWDISSLTNATDMFNSTSMTLNNMDSTLRGWAKLDTAAGESAIQSNVTWSIANYTDATARQYLIDTYHWTISGGSFDGSKTIHGNSYTNTLNTTATKTTLHGLGGNDTLTGGTTDDILVGGAGDDTLTGAGGRDIFDYGFKNAGNDTITDFTIGNTTTNSNADIINLSDLLIGYDSSSNLSDFITVVDITEIFEGTNTKLIIDHDGTGALNNLVTITLENVAYRTDLLTDLIANGNLVLYTNPTLTITGSGGTNTVANTITFNFSKAIKDGSFTVDDIGIVNGTINSDSFTRVSATQYTIMVTPSLGGKHSNVAIMVEVNTLKGSTNTLADISDNDNTNTATTKNTTRISYLKNLVDIDGKDSDVDLTHWDVSHASNANRAFSNATAFNQDIGSWEVSNVADMSRMFYNAHAFNQDIDSWNVSKVSTMSYMFYNTHAFNQDISSWDISSLTNAMGMFKSTAMTVDNMDNTLRGWAKLDTAAGESAIGSNVAWSIANYTDATARQYLIDTYHWTINAGNFDGIKTIKGNNNANTLNTTATKTTLHGLGGNDTLIGGATNDILIGGAGDDTLTGAGGRDIFDYGFKNAGNDTITDFTLGNTATKSNADTINLSDLLIGYSATSNLSDFVTAAADGAHTKLTIDHDGTNSGNSVTITLKNVAYTADLLTSLIANGNLVLEGIKPTLMITGSGGANTAANTITFNFSKAIKDGSFTVDDIGIVNGTINSGSFTKVSETQYTVMVTPNLGGKHSNVAITVAANSFTDVTGNTNTTIAKNTTKISNLKELIDINTDLTHWDVSHVSDAYKTFYSATTFNQDISGWDVSKVTNMQAMFHSASAFNQDIGSWDISSLKNATGMFNASAMTLNNMDSTLRGWAKLDTAAGESAIQSNVTWSIANYTDATARQYLIDTYHWTINAGNFDGIKTIKGNNNANTLNTTATKTTLHGLGGNDTLIGGATNDILIGGAGDDTLTGAGGRDIFDYGFKNAGNDTITDFTLGNTATKSNADTINLSDLLIGYSATSNLSDFVTAAADGAHTKLTINHDGTNSGSSVTITLKNVAHTANLLTNMIANGNLVLEAIRPTLMITGSGGANTAANTITFNFSAAIKDGSFAVDDIGITNGSINLGSFTKLSDTQYTIMVTPDLGGKHSNVAITIADNAFTDAADNTNTIIITNTTNIIDLKKWVDIDGNGSDADLTGWDVSHVTDASRAFFDATTFNQNIGNWDVSKVTNMSHMFLSAKAFNQNIGGWHVSKVTNMTYMFHNATSFNQNIGSWDVGKVTDMSYMFSSADAFNQNIGNWNVSNVTTMDSMFWAATAFNQDIGNWDISSLTNATDMFNSTSMTLNNMDSTLRGWAKLDTAAGESAIQSNVTWSIANYTDATARQYLIDTYHWTINAGNFDGIKTIKGNNNANTLNTTATKTTLHGLGGNDTLIGGAKNDILIGGAGDDALTGAGGRDIFDYGFKNAGNDTITDFTLGNTSINTNADTLNLSDLLIGYDSNSNLSDFITVVDEGANTKLIIDHDGTGALNNLVTITLKNVAYRTDLLTGLIANGNLVLDTSPTLIITGSGGKNTAANTIAFNFSKAIKDGSFTVDDIGIANGTIHSDSFTKVTPLQILLAMLMLPSLKT